VRATQQPSYRRLGVGLEAEVEAILPDSIAGAFPEDLEAVALGDREVLAGARDQLVEQVRDRLAVDAEGEFAGEELERAREGYATISSSRTLARHCSTSAWGPGRSGYRGGSRLDRACAGSDDHRDVVR
jgi:hypothetical protein